MHARTHAHTHRQTYGWTDGQTGSHTDRQAGRQAYTNIVIEWKTYITAWKLLDSVIFNSNISYLPESLNLLEASFLVHRAPFFRPKCLPLRGHVTVSTMITWQQKFIVDGGELVPLVAVHDELLLSCDHRRDLGGVGTLAWRKVRDAPES